MELEEERWSLKLTAAERGGRGDVGGEWSLQSSLDAGLQLPGVLFHQPHQLPPRLPGNHQHGHWRGLQTGH